MILCSEILPKSYIENYNFIEKNIKFLNWPEKPKIILLHLIIILMMFSKYIP